MEDLHGDWKVGPPTRSARPEHQGHDDAGGHEGIRSKTDAGPRGKFARFRPTANLNCGVGRILPDHGVLHVVGQDVRVVPRTADGIEQNGGVTDNAIREPDARALRGKVDGRFNDPRDFESRLFHPADARRAGHARDLEDHFA